MKRDRSPTEEAARWRYEPLGVDRFPVGQGPFRARGLAYVGALKYVDTRLRGGRDAFLARLGLAHPFASFYEQIFLVTADYDVSPLVQLYLVIAALEGNSVDSVVKRGSRWSGEHDPKSVWRPSLRGATPSDVAARLNFAFDRYFPPSSAEALSSQPEAFEGELRRLPACMAGLYVSGTAGFYEGALGWLGAANVRTQFARPAPDGLLAGVAMERVRFSVRWTLGPPPTESPSAPPASSP
jgi:hypothetical protein